MAYEFKPYRSVYRDPGSVKVAETLRQRYVENFASETMLDKALNEMLVEAEFAGDVEKAEELRQRLRNSASGRAERGDFENLGMQINMDVRDFSRNYEPIRKNYEVREQDKAAKQKLVEAGRITNEQYNDWEKRSLMNYDEETGDLQSYRGLSYDDNGAVVAGSAYTPTTIAHNVNVDKEILNALQSIEAEKSGGYVTKVPEMRRLVDTNGDGQIDSNDEAYEYMIRRSDGTTEYIDPERVRAVTQEVLNRGDVRAFMQQDADFYTYDMREDELDAMLGARKAAIEAKIMNGNLSQNDMAAAQQALAQINSALDSSVGRKREVARAAKMDAESERLTNMAIDAKAVSSTVGGSFEVEYSARQEEMWRQARANTNQASPPTPRPSAPGVPATHTSAVRNPDTGEVDTQSVTDYMTAQQVNAEAGAQTVVDDYNFLLPAGPMSAQTGVDYLDNVSMDEMRTAIEAQADGRGMIEMPDGTMQSAERAMEILENAKNQVEYYRRLQKASDLMIETANNEAQTNAEDLAALPEVQEFLGDPGSPTPAGREQQMLNYAAGLMEGIMREFEHEGVQSSAVGNIVDYVTTMLGGKLTREQVQAEFDDVQADLELQASNPLGYPFDENRSDRARARQNSKASGGANSASSKAASAVRELTDRVEARQQWMHDNTEGNTTYPIWDAPSYATDDDWKAVKEVIKNQGTAGLLPRVSAAKDANGNAISIEQAIANQGIDPSTTEIEGIQVTYTTDVDGRPIPAYVVSFKGNKTGNQSSQKGSARVIIPESQMVAHAPRVQGKMDTATLDEHVLKSAYSVHNNFQGVTKKTKKVTVPVNDGGLDLQVSFAAIETPAADGAPGSFDLTQGPVTISGTVNGQPITGSDGSATMEVSYAEYQLMMRDYGAQTGRTADMEWKARTAQQSN